MSIQTFVNDKSTREEVFNYIDKYVEEHTLNLLKTGKDTSGMKNAFDVIRGAKNKMISEFTPKKEVIKKDKSV